MVTPYSEKLDGSGAGWHGTQAPRSRQRGDSIDRQK
jgi:hypothetical protein